MDFIRLLQMLIIVSGNGRLQFSGVTANKSEHGVGPSSELANLLL